MGLVRRGRALGHGLVRNGSTLDHGLVCSGRALAHDLVLVDAPLPTASSAMDAPLTMASSAVDAPLVTTPSSLDAPLAMASSAVDPIRVFETRCSQTMSVPKVDAPLGLVRRGRALGRTFVRRGHALGHTASSDVDEPLTTASSGRGEMCTPLLRTPPMPPPKLYTPPYRTLHTCSVHRVKYGVHNSRIFTTP